MRVHAVFCLLTALLFPFAPAWAEDVDLELVLLADASGSIGNDEIRYQRQGYADALASADVLDAIATSGRHQKIAVTYMEWGQWDSQVVVVPWRVIASAEDARNFKAELLAAPRTARGRNAIGNALIKAAAAITSNTFEGTRKVIDLSADSVNSWGGAGVPEARKVVLEQGITINGLAVLCRKCSSGRPVSYDLEQAFEDTIIGGTGSFVVSADEPANFALAVKRKLILEIARRQPQTEMAEQMSASRTRPEETVSQPD
ncbi:MAG: DUF1194 domain-containing protein [Rhizobiales bacterium]|nr:DUF1194 domain-containing protein [Hyphomicrobiales bacterium]